METSFLQYFTLLLEKWKIVQYTVILPFFLPILSFAISLYFEAQEEKEVFYRRYFKHLCIVIAFGLVCITVLSSIPAKITWFWFVTVIVICTLYLLYLYAFIMSLKNRSTLYAKKIFDKHAIYLRDGTTTRHMDFTYRKPRGLLFVYDKYRYIKMCCNYHIANSDIQSAYSTLQDIKKLEKQLYKNEIDSMSLYMAHILINHGALRQAKECLNSVSTTNSNSLVVLSEWQEQTGDIKMAFDTLERAITLPPFTDKLNIDKPPNKFSQKEKDLACHKAVVYNNLGRLYLIQHKPQKALYFYKKALRIAIAADEDMKLLHCCYSNVIDQLIIQNAPDEEISRYYSEYKKCITKESITNKIAFYNFKLGADRQRNIIDNEHQRFFQMYTELLKVAIGEDKYTLEICAFTTLFYYGKKARHELMLVINDIKTDFDKYQNLELLIKLNIYKDLLYTLETGQKEMHEIYKNITDKIKHYYKTTAIKEITEKLNKLDEYQVHYRCNLIFNDIYIRSRNENYNNFPKLVERFDDILEEYEKERLYFSKLDILLFVAEECMINQLCNAQGRTKYSDIMTKYVNLAINEIKKTKNFLGMDIFHLRTAYCLYYLERIIESQEHFDFFQSNSFSINHLPCLYKEKYYELQNNLPKLLSFLLMKSENRIILEK